MTTIYRLLIALAVALPFSGFFSHYNLNHNLGFNFDPKAFLVFSIAGIISILLALLVPAKESNRQAPHTSKKTSVRQRSGKPSSDESREVGEVKWFNYNKGFGFITRDSGGDIFVHHKSINTKGRRGLREGQRVSYIVATSDKGLQAEEVETED